VAEHATSKVDSLDHDSASGEASKTRPSYARQLRRRWLRLISLTRVTTIAERLCGASASAAEAVGAEGSLPGRFTWAASGGSKWGVYSRVLIVKT